MRERGDGALCVSDLALGASVSGILEIGHAVKGNRPFFCLSKMIDLVLAFERDTAGAPIRGGKARSA